MTQFIVRFFVSVLILIQMFGCVTGGTKSQSDKLAPNTFFIYEAKGALKDIEKDKTSKFDLDIISDRGSYLRIDATGPLGIGLATFALSKDYLTATLYREKKYYYGHASPQALRKFLHMDLDIHDLQNIFIDQKLDERSWSCRQDGRGLPQACQHKAENLKVEWSDRTESSQRVILTTEKIILTLDIVRKENKTLKDSVEIFNLKSPDGYKKTLLQ